jgi:hypothetical protein
MDEKFSYLTQLMLQTTSISYFAQDRFARDKSLYLREQRTISAVGVVDNIIE